MGRAAILPRPPGPGNARPGGRARMTIGATCAKLAPMASAERSQSDLEVLRQSHRGKFIALAALLVGAGGVLWYRYGRDAPIGNREDTDHVFVVPQSGLRYKTFLEKWGFVPQEARADTFVDELKEKLPEATETGAAAILKLADWAGYAYVAFEDPATIDFSGVNIQGGLPTFEPYHRFAVLTAGDYAFPHKLTVNAKPSEIMNGPELDLLSALFAQEPLASTLRDDPRNSPDVIVLRTKVQEGIHAYTAVADAEATVAKIEGKARALLVDKEKGKPAPSLLGGVHESINPIALADGGSLLLTRRIHFSSSTGFNADLDLDRTWNFAYVPPGADPVAGRVPCTSLLGGSLDETGRRPSFRFSPQGDSLLIHSDGLSQLFKLEAGQCALTHLGNITVPLVRGEDPGEPHASGRVARARNDGAESVVYLVKPADDVPQELARTAATSFQLPVWLGPDALAVAGSPNEGDLHDGLFFLSPDHPDKALRVDAINFDASTQIRQVAPAPAGPQGPRLLVTTWGERGIRLFRVDIPAPIAKVFTDTLAGVNMAAQPQAVRDGLELLVAQPDIAGWTFAPLTQEVAVYDPIASTKGDLVAFTSEQEIALVPLSGGPLRVLTSNELEDHTPMFSADGKTILFRTRFPIEKTTWTITTGRSIPVGP